MMTASSPLLQIEQLKTYYPIKKGVFSRTVGHVKAVDDVSLCIYEGETLGLVGESGCGKSSFGRSIVRLEDPYEGRIWFDNEDITSRKQKELKRVRTRLQIIFQDPYASLNPRQRVADILAEPISRINWCRALKYRCGSTGCLIWWGCLKPTKTGIRTSSQAASASGSASPGLSHSSLSSLCAMSRYLHLTCRFRRKF